MAQYKLRPHHGLCAQYFRGRGYSDGFVRNMTEIVALPAGEEIRLTCGCDVICSECPHNVGGVCESDEKVLSHDKKVLSLCSLAEGDILTFGEFREKVRRDIILAGKRGYVCSECSWSELCASIEKEMI